MTHGILALLTATLIAWTCPVANAAPITTINFDSLAPGTVVSTIDGVTFSYAPFDPLSSGFPLVVSTGFAASSDFNYLGVQDGSSEFFQPGDIVNLTFGTAISQLDVTFIAPSGTLDGAFGLMSGPDSVTSTGADMFLLATGDEAFTLHLTPSSSFVSAVLFSDPNVAPLFSLDDITARTVPEPGTLSLLAILLATLFFTRRARLSWRVR